MRVSPCCRCQLVKKEFDPVIQLACLDNGVPCRCASFVCCSRTSAGPKGLFPPKVGPAQQQDILPEDLVSHRSVGGITVEDDDDKKERKSYVKSNLKKAFECSGAVSWGDDLPEALDETGHEEVPGCTERKRVQWTDMCGKELVEIREYEPSESDEEFEGRTAHSCSCTIM